MEELRLLDSEGRCIITDHRAFILFNIYFPNEGSDPVSSESNDRISIARSDFRIMYYKAIEIRLRALIQAKRECIVVGDFNVTHQEIDHCDPQKNKKELNITHYQNTRGRMWFHNLLIQNHDIYKSLENIMFQMCEPNVNDPTHQYKKQNINGIVIDTLRYFRPKEKGLFTHWSNILNARPVNYGTRIDYIVTTPNLIYSFQDSNCLQTIMGSDHCPVIASILKWDFTPPKIRQIWIDAAKICPIPCDQLNINSTSNQLAALTPTQPPTLCAKNYSQFQGNQTSLKTFFNQSKQNTTQIIPVQNSCKVENNIEVISPDSQVNSRTVTADTIDSANPIKDDIPLSQNADQNSATFIDTIGEDSTIPVVVDNGMTSPIQVDLSKRSLNIGDKTSDNFFNHSKPNILEQDTTEHMNISTSSHLKKRPASSLMSTEIKKVSPVSKKFKNSKIGKQSDHQQQKTLQHFFQGKDLSSSIKDTTKDIPLSSVENYLNPSDEMKALIIDEAQLWDLNNDAKKSWGQLFTMPPTPNCKSHNEPAKLFTVNKKGLNHGKKFYLCHRPVAPGEEGRW